MSNKEEKTKDIMEEMFANLPKWHRMLDLIPILKAVADRKFTFGIKPNCKYITIRVDMRDGCHRIFDRDEKEVSIEDLKNGFLNVKCLENYKEPEVLLKKLDRNKEYDLFNELKSDIVVAMGLHDETMDDVIYHTLNEGFDSKDLRFTIWTKNRIYFPAIEHVGEVGSYTVGVNSVPRNPCEEKTSPRFDS